MRAIQIDKHGDPSVLQWRHVPDPVPAHAEVLVRTVASSINPVDWKTRAWDRGPAFPMTLGWDLAGVVVTSDDPAWSPGDRVVVMSAQLATAVGTWAELVALPAGLIARAPETVSLADAATLPLAGMTARVALDQLQPQVGQRMLVAGAAGGVGSLMVQLGRHAGLRVDGLVSRTAHAATAEQLGAETVFTDTDQVPANSYDLVFDTAGVADQLGRALITSGQYAWVTDDPAPDHPHAINPQVYEDGNLLRGLVDEVDAGRLRLSVAAYYPITEIRHAHERFEAGGLGGKLVLLF